MHEWKMFIFRITQIGLRYMLNFCFLDLDMHYLERRNFRGILFRRWEGQNGRISRMINFLSKSLPILTLFLAHFDSFFLREKKIKFHGI